MKRIKLTTEIYDDRNGRESKKTQYTIQLSDDNFNKLLDCAYIALDEINKRLEANLENIPVLIEPHLTLDKQVKGGAMLTVFRTAIKLDREIKDIKSSD